MLAKAALVRSAVIVLAGILCTASVIKAAPLSPADAGTFVTRVIYKGIAILLDPTVDEAQRQRAFGAFIAQNVDIPRIARFALGRHWADATEVERRQFIAAYARYLSQFYAIRLGQFTGAIVSVTGTLQMDDEILVKTLVTFPGPLPRTATAERWDIGWTVADTPQGFKIEDIEFQGMSLRLSQRRGLMAMMERAGGTLVGLIQAILSLITQAVP
jgi:phospholipid transport system substrate-binding protein